MQKNLKFYRLLYLRPPHLFHLSYREEEHAGALGAAAHCAGNGSARGAAHIAMLALLVGVLGWGLCGAAAAYDVTSWAIAVAQPLYVMHCCRCPGGLWAFAKLSLASAIMLCLGRLLLSRRSRHPGSPLPPLGLETAARRSRGRHAPSIQMPSPLRAARLCRGAPSPAMLCSGTKPPPQTNPPQARLAAPIPHA